MRVAILSLCFSVTASTAAFGCMCRENPTPQQALKQADAVFLGKIVSTKETPPNKEGHPDRLFVVKVAKAWKGVRTDQVTVTTATHSCGFEAKVGTTHIFYTSKAPEGRWSTESCDRTRRVLDPATDEDLKALGTPARTFK